MDVFEKSEVEEFNISLDWNGKLPVAATSVSSVTATVEDRITGADTSASMLEGSVTTTAMVSRIRVKGGLAGYTYRVRAVAVLDDSSEIESDVLLHVRDQQ